MSTIGTLLCCIQGEDEIGITSQPTGKRSVREVGHMDDSLPSDRRETNYRATQFIDSSGFVSSIYIFVYLHTYTFSIVS